MWRFGSRHNCKQLCKQLSQGMAYLGHALPGQGNGSSHSPALVPSKVKKRGQSEEHVKDRDSNFTDSQQKQTGDLAQCRTGL